VGNKWGRGSKVRRPYSLSPEGPKWGRVLEERQQGPFHLLWDLLDAVRSPNGIPADQRSFYILNAVDGFPCYIMLTVQFESGDYHHHLTYRWEIDPTVPQLLRLWP